MSPFEEHKSVIIISSVLILLVISVVLIASKLYRQKEDTTFTPVVSQIQSDDVVKKAVALFEEKKKTGMDFSQGSCLSEEIQPDWSVDIAHNPRLTLDNFPENQCTYYLQGNTHHFVELDTQGNVIRVN